MTDMICRETMRRCLTPGMCAPFGGCGVPDSADVNESDNRKEITMDRDFMGTIHIKVGDFDFIQIQYQYPYTDNAGTARLARKIMDLLEPEKER